MNELFDQIKTRFLETWNKLNKIQKIIISVSIFTFLIFVIILSVMAGKINYEPLYTELDAKDAATIKAQLDRRGILYKITGNGTVIEVDKSKKYSVRLDLSKDGFSPGGTIGLEIFDQTNLVATEFDKKMMFLRAQKGEMERTIASLKQIKTAIVNITPANDSVFADEKTDAKAAIVLNLEPFEKLNEENIKGIMLLVASSVEGLSPENIDVVDMTGKILSYIVDFGDGDSPASNKKLEMQKNIEKKLTKQAAFVLSVLGGGNYKIAVSVNLDFDKEYIDKESFTTPTVEGAQMATGLVRSQQDQNESYEGAKNGEASGIVGTESNIPGYVGVDDEEGNKNKYNKSSSIVNYDMDRTKSTFEKSLGATKQVRVSVVLNSKAEYFKDREFTDLERIKFENMVKPAVSFNSARGDIINVTSMPFDTSSRDKFQEVIDSQEKYRKYFIFALVLIGILIAIGIAISIVLRNIEERKIREKERQAVEELIPEFENIALGDQVSIEDQERQEKEDQIKNAARDKPEQVANLIKTWMIED